MRRNPRCHAPTDGAPAAEEEGFDFGGVSELRADVAHGAALERVVVTIQRRPFSLKLNAAPGVTMT